MKKIPNIYSTLDNIGGQINQKTSSNISLYLKQQYENLNLFFKKADKDFMQVEKENQNPNEKKENEKLLNKQIITPKASWNKTKQVNEKINYEERKSIKRLSPKKIKYPQKSEKKKSEYTYINKVKHFIRTPNKKTKLYINNNGSPCDKIGSLRKRRYLTRFSRNKRFFLLKKQRQQFLKNKLNNENKIKQVLFNDRLNGVYIVKKYLNQSFENRASTYKDKNLNNFWKINKFNDNKNIDYKEEIRKNTNNKNKNHHTFQNNNCIGRNYNYQELSSNFSYRPSINKGKSILQIFENNSQIKDTNSIKVENSNQNPNSYSKKNICLIYNCNSCSKNIKKYFDNKLIQSMCDHCKGFCKLEKIYSSEKGLMSNFNCLNKECSNTKRCKSIAISTRLLIIGAPICNNCDQITDIGIIKFKKFQVIFKRFSIKMCSKCNLILEKKQKKKYLSKNGFITSENLEEDKCTRCNGDLNTLRKKLIMKTILNEEYIYSIKKKDSDSEISYNLNSDEEKALDSDNNSIFKYRFDSKFNVLEKKKKTESKIKELIFHNASIKSPIKINMDLEFSGYSIFNEKELFKISNKKSNVLNNKENSFKAQNLALIKNTKITNSDKCLFNASIIETRTNNNYDNPNFKQKNYKTYNNFLPSLSKN